MIGLLEKFVIFIEYRFKTFFEFFYRVDEHHLFLIAAGIAFNILLYLMPMLLVAVYTVNLLMGADKISALLMNSIDKILPPTETNINLIKSTMTEVNYILGHSAVAGWIGIISLLWLSSTLFSSIRSGLNRIFNIKSEKIFLIYRLRDIFFTFILGFLFLLLSYIIPAVSVLTNYVSKSVEPPYDWILSGMFVTTFSLLTSFTLFFSIFRFIPDKKVPGFVVISSTFISLGLVEVSRKIFAWYVLKFGTYGKFYGTYAVLVSVAFWIYYLVLIILFSAEFSNFIFEKLEQRRKIKN